MKFLDLFKKNSSEAVKQSIKENISEEKIREEAYFLWEKSPNEGDSNYYWNKAKENLCSKKI